MTKIVLQEGKSLQHDRQRERMKRATQVLQSFASGFTLRPITVRIARGGQAPAFSTSDRIWFEESLMADLTTKAGVATLKGLTFHEMCHILLTPRDGSEIRQWVGDNGFHRAWNILEDQRIESNLIALYPSIQPWFEAMIAEYMLKNPEGWRMQFPLIRGRKYLDARIRRVIRDSYVNQQDVKEISDIIDEYRLLNMTVPEDVETSKPLVERFHELLKGMNVGDPNGHDVRGENEHTTNVKSKPMTKGQQKTANERLKDMEFLDEDDVDTFYPEDMDDDIEEDDLDDDTQPSEDGGEDNSDSEEDGGDKPSDSGGDSSSDSEDSSAPEGAGNGAGKGNPLEDTLRDLLQENLDETLERLGDKLADDIALYNGEAFLEGEEVPAPPKAQNTTKCSPSADAYTASEQFARELAVLRADNEPAWLDRTDSGRVNPFRWEQGCELEEAFDRFEEGRWDTTDIECAILLDLSGSMMNDNTKAHECMWAIKNALDSINASTTVVGYSDDGYYSRENSSVSIYDRTEKVGSTMTVVPASGGTDPTKALQYAKYILAQSSRAIKLLIVITDGDWNTASLEKSEATIRELREGGVLTSLAWLNSYDMDMNTVNTHECEIVAHVRKAGDLFHLGRSIVEVGISRQLTL